MAKVKPTINSLDFDGVKTSIINYIKTKPEFLDYDFEGSALNSLIDVLAYNTLYYGFYSNMISSESFLDTAKLESSIVSLCKPLGILVPGKSSSRATLTVKNEGTSVVNILGYETVFSGVLNGVNYNYYTLGDTSIIPGATEELKLYESKNVIKNLELNVDLALQTAFLGNTNIDITTVQVKVTNPENPTGTLWAQRMSIDTSIQENSEIYFIERTSSGFILIFGKKTINDFGELTVGQDITQQDVVTVSYLVSSGSGSNNISQINVTPLTLVDSELTYGGTDGPDLETIKYFAPKYFASNDRAVTKDDYYGILFKNNKIQNFQEINIWGGEEAEPVSHGRVFVSILDVVSEDTPRVKEILNLLKNKSVITVLPEFVLPVSLTLNAGFSVRLNASYNSNTANLEASIRNKLNQEYSKAFDFYFTSTDASAIIKSASDAILRATVNTATLNIQTNINYAVSDKIIYFKNEFGPSIVIGGAVISDPIPTTRSAFGIILKDFPTEFVNGQPTVGKLVGLYNDGNQNETTNSSGFDWDELGYVDYKSGIVILYDYFLREITNRTATYGLYVIPKYTDIIISKNEVTMELNITGIQFT